MVEGAAHVDLVNQADRQGHAAGRANAVCDRHDREHPLLLDLAELGRHISGQFAVESLDRGIQLGQSRAGHGRLLLGPRDHQILELNEMIDDSMH